MGRRIDVVLLIGPAIFVIEFKIGETGFTRAALDQVCDYALDLKNFHETSHNPPVVPILVATDAASPASGEWGAPASDGLWSPLTANAQTLPSLIHRVLRETRGSPINRKEWEAGRYRPTPTIIEAATALYSRHSVSDISRKEAGAVNLAKTSDTIDEIIRSTRSRSRKSVCFVTGVPGAGKTLVGLNVATKYMDPKDDLHSVFLSGNGPLVNILREALARDHVQRASEVRGRTRLSEARSKVKAFIQNVHHFRDECLQDSGPPAEHVALFDEAQRAWNKGQTSSFMRRKKKRAGFNESEPEYLISCLDRHRDWAVVICLVGGGQEINTGEAGIGEWIASLDRSFPDWRVHISPRLTDSEYGAGETLKSLAGRRNVAFHEELHLATSMRSFRAENVSQLVKQILDLDVPGARDSLAATSRNYPIVLSRNLDLAKEWVRGKARGSERYGIVVSSQAERLKPHAISVRSPVDPVHWFLGPKEDVRSSYYLEDVATEFHVQGLELDWTCVTWDADFRHTRSGWEPWSFRGDRWNRVRKDDRQRYMKNAYRVLLTRARQGMVIVVPEGDGKDPTRSPEFYDSTFDYLRSIGIAEI
ncbi:MAG TPA: DUF2075 domain-containing protein [Planctomycetota bacterium]|nr:DUF2075 domain-containing protein [Planctomycetota bacterium]